MFVISWCHTRRRLGWANYVQFAVELSVLVLYMSSIMQKQVKIVGVIAEEGLAGLVLILLIACNFV